jgi:hypothetical protein
MRVARGRSVVGEFYDFVFDAELLALEVGNSAVIRQGSGVLFLDQMLKIGMLGFEFVNALHVSHYRASISTVELGQGGRPLERLLP